MGPQGGRYSAVGTDLNGQRVYRDGGGRYYTLDGGTKVQVSNPASSPNVSITQQHTIKAMLTTSQGNWRGKGIVQLREVSLVSVVRLFAILTSYTVVPVVPELME